MDDFIYADPSRTICSLPQLYINVRTCVVYHFLNELRASLGPTVASWPLFLGCCPHGARLRNRCDASAKSRTASTVLARGAVLFSRGPPRRAGMLLNASPTFSRSSRRRCLSSGQSRRTWITLSRPPQTHWSSSRKRNILAYDDNQQCPVRSCVMRYARFRGKFP